MQIKIDKMGQIKKRMEKAWNLKREKKESEKVKENVSLTALKNNFT